MDNAGRVSHGLNPEKTEQPLKTVQNPRISLIHPNERLFPFKTGSSGLTIVRIA